MSERFNTTVYVGSREEASRLGNEQAVEWFGTDDIEVRLISVRPHANDSGRIDMYEVDVEAELVERIDKGRFLRGS